MTGPAVPSGLEALLAEATLGPWETHGAWASHKSWTDIRGSNGWWVAETTHLPEDAYKDSDARLIALAPDAVRLLIDMAAWVDEILTKPYRVEERWSDGNDLIRRFAALDQRAGTA